MAAHFVESETLATELLHELKASAKRWFIVSIIEMLVILGIILGFVWYLSTIDNSCYTQNSRQISTENSEVNQSIGGD